jgi:GAF domain-containing protein
MNLFEQRFGSRDVEVVISDLLVATADSSDALLDDSVSQVLGMLRQSLKMDVVFVSEFVDGRRVFRFVDADGRAPIAAGESSPLEESYCKLVVDGRLPELVTDVARLSASVPLPKAGIPVGAHLSTPIVMNDGQAYGTLCCFSASPNEALRLRDLTTLRHCAQLVARKLEAGRALRERAMQDTEIMAPDWALQPIEPRRR